MREILFRGKSVKTGKWEIGWYVKAPFDSWPLQDCIIPMDRAEAGEYTRVEVYPETVGQYSGNSDYFNDPIFEGDVLESRASEDEGDWKKWLVTFNDGMFEVNYQNGKRKKIYERECLCVDNLNLYGFVKVGNIYDNPELLEVE